MAFILNNGETHTYCNRYNDNPIYATEHFYFHLDPDRDGPCDLPRWCAVATRPPFYHTLVIDPNPHNPQIPPHLRDRHGRIHFLPDEPIDCSPSSHDCASANLAFEDVAKLAVAELLAEIQAWTDRQLRRPILPN